MNIPIWFYIKYWNFLQKGCFDISIIIYDKVKLRYPLLQHLFFRINLSAFNDALISVAEMI